MQRKVKILLAIGLVLLSLGVAGLVFYIKTASSNPVPTSIKNQVNFKIIYPSASSKLVSYDQSSYSFRTSQNVLSFKVKYNGNDFAFSEQPAPSALGAGDSVYFPALGIHPYAQFKTKLGLVALTRFWASGSLEPIGQSALITSKGTLLTIQSKDNLSNQEWKNLCDILKISK